MTEKNIHLITKYEALFNESNASCAITIDTQQFPIDCLIEKELLFSIDYKKSNIRIESEKDIYVFLNADNQLIYYASKTNQLPLLYGTTNPPEIIGALVAEFDFNS